MNAQQVPQCNQRRLTEFRVKLNFAPKEMSNSKTLVRFVYVLPEVLHGDFLSEVKYLFNPEENILQAFFIH
jgi:hypothetical protein